MTRRNWLYYSQDLSLLFRSQRSSLPRPDGMLAALAPLILIESHDQGMGEKRSALSKSLLCVNSLAFTGAGREPRWNFFCAFLMWFGSLAQLVLGRGPKEMPARCSEARLSCGL